MISLITYPPLGKTFSLSPFCCKAAHLLNYAGVPWQREDQNDPRKMPYGKLPAIRTPEHQIIADTDAIRFYLEEQGVDFQPGLSDAQKAVSVALIRMAEEHLYFHIVLDRWGRDDVWPVIREMYFHEIPGLFRKPITNGLRKALMRGMNAQGLARYSEGDRLARVEQDLKAVGDLLWQGPFLMGEHVSLVDFSIAPMLDALRLTPVETPLALRVAGDPILIDYIDRVSKAVTEKTSAQVAA